MRRQSSGSRLSPSNSSLSLNSTDCGTNNFATLRTTSIVTRQIKEHEKENQMYEQMSGYKRMRRQHQKALMQLEVKCRQELDEHRQKLDKEYDSLLQQFSKELEKLQLGHHSELEKKVKRERIDTTHMLCSFAVTKVCPIFDGRFLLCVCRVTLVSSSPDPVVSAERVVFV